MKRSNFKRCKRIFRPCKEKKLLVALFTNIIIFDCIVINKIFQFSYTVYQLQMCIKQETSIESKFEKINFLEIEY